MTIKGCVCGHSIDDHLENEGEQVIAGECARCDCQCYEEEENEEL